MLPKLLHPLLSGFRPTSYHKTALTSVTNNIYVAKPNEHLQIDLILLFFYCSLLLILIFFNTKKKSAID